MEAEEFESQVIEYCKLQETLKEAEKRSNVLKASIYEYMDMNSIGDQTVNGYKLTRRLSHRTTVDDAKLLAVVKNWGDVGARCIKTREYVDEDALESLVYNHKIGKDEHAQLDTCRTVKSVYSLYTKARK